MQTNLETKDITRDEYLVLVTSRRHLVRVGLATEVVYELLDTETNERFRIKGRELHPGLPDGEAASSHFAAGA